MRIKAAVKQLKRDVLALYYALHDPRTPLLSKLLPWLVLAYALSPLDLIPDFIPVLGYLDDLLLLPLGLWLSCKMIPAEVSIVQAAKPRLKPCALNRCRLQVFNPSFGPCVGACLADKGLLMSHISRGG
jgi:uncharacterized membrane protein YkvA (DUF1232 family)